MTMGYLIQIDGFDPVANAAITLRAASHDAEALCHADGQIWWPAIDTLPTLRYDLFDGDFGGAIEAPSGSLALVAEPWPNLGRYALHDARVRIWRGDVGAAFSAFAPVFDGRVDAQPDIADGMAQFAIRVDDRWLDQPLLATYAGTTGLEGEAGLKGQVKPLLLGAPRFAPATLIDPVDVILQLSAYGAIEDIEIAFERAARFGPSSGDFASLAALRAAVIPNGGWATCKALGLVRHGAPLEGMPSYHVRGDRAGSDGWVRLPGAIIHRIAEIAGGAGRVFLPSLTALNAARPYPLSLAVTEQTTARELIQRIAASVNAVAGVDWLGRLFVVPVGIGAPSGALSADGSTLPLVSDMRQIGVSAPWWRLALQVDRTWAVHAYSDIAFTATLLDRGRYEPAETYREGDIVDLADGTRWLFIATTPATGAAPPSPAHWAGLPIDLDLPKGTDIKTAKAMLGAFAEAFAAQAAADDKAMLFYQPTAPGLAESDVNDRWVDTDDDNREYRRVGKLVLAGTYPILDGKAPQLPWVETSDRRISQAILEAAGAQATADGKVASFFGNSAPVAEGVGDLWYHPPSGELRRWNGAAWEMVSTVGATAAQIAQIGQALSDAANAQATADGKIDTYYQASVPTGGSVGDLWFDTDDGNKLYRHDCSGFVLSRDTGIATAISAAAGAQATADGKVVTFTGAAEPAAQGVGDLWWDTANRVLKRWGGTTWGTVSAAGVEDAATLTVAMTVDSKARVFKFKSDGTIYAGQLPATATVRVLRGTADVTASATKSIAAAEGCTATISAAGVVTISAVTGSGYIQIAGSYDGKTLAERIDFTRLDDPPPPPTPSEASAGMGDDISNDAYSATPTRSLVLKAGASGKIRVTYSGTYNVNVPTSAGTREGRMSGKLAQKPYLGAWTDLASETNGTVAQCKRIDIAPGEVTYDTRAGSISMTFLVTGLTAETTYEFGVFLRRSYGTGVMSGGGSFAVKQEA